MALKVDPSSVIVMNSPGTGPNVFFYVGKKLPIGASTGIPIPERNILPVGKGFFS